MKATIEPVEGNRVRLSVEVDEAEFEAAVDEAFRRIAREVRLPGFRPGKAPRKVLEAKLGTGFAREEALREALPDYYARAVRDHEVDVIAAPEIDITAGQEGGPVAFDAVVEVRPEVEVTGHGDLTVTIPSPAVSDEDVDRQIDRLRESFAELEVVGRPARDGDHVTVDIAGWQDDEPVSGLTADDYLYEVGGGAVIPEIDEHLRGAKVGDILEFTAAHPDPELRSGDTAVELRLRILVKEIKEKVLPEVDDEWANEASEFETVDDLRQSLRDRAAATRVVVAQMALRDAAATAAGDLVDAELVPDAMVEGELHHRVEDLLLRLQAQGMDVEQYAQATGQTQEEVVEELRGAAAQAARVDLALRAVAVAEGIEATDEDLEEEIARVAERVDQSPEEVREALTEGDRMAAVRSDLRKRKALDWLVEHVAIVDEQGEPIDREDLVIPDGGDQTDDTDEPAPDTDAGPGQDTP